MSWAQCSACEKWRTLERGRREWEGDFTCSMNVWNASFNSCSVAEEASISIEDNAYVESSKKKRPRTENTDTNAAPKLSKMMLIPTEPIARTEQYEAFHLPEIDENLYVGSAQAAKCLPWLHKEGVKYILNMTQKGQVPSYYPAEIDYLRIPIEDLIDAKIELHWEAAFAFLDKV